MTTNTPRTDALKAFQDKEYYSSDHAVRLHYFEGFARELERENAELRADKERYDWLKDGCGSAWAYKYLRNNFRINDDALDAARKEAQS